MARALRVGGVPTFCGDTLSRCRAPEHGVTYLPEGMGWSQASRWVANQWLTMPGPWCCEGSIMVRALRKIAAANQQFVLNGAEIWVARSARGETTLRQEGMARAVETMWGRVALAYPWAVEVS